MSRNVTLMLYYGTVDGQRTAARSQVQTLQFYWVFKLEFQQPNFETRYRAVEIHNWSSPEF